MHTIIFTRKTILLAAVGLLCPSVASVANGMATGHRTYRAVSNNSVSFAQQNSDEDRFSLTAEAALSQRVTNEGIDIKFAVKNNSESTKIIGNPLDCLEFTALRDNHWVKFPVFIPRDIADALSPDEFDLPYRLRSVIIGNKELLNQELVQKEYSLKPGETITIYATINKIINDDKTSNDDSHIAINVPPVGRYKVQPHYRLKYRSDKQHDSTFESIILPPFVVNVVDANGNSASQEVGGLEVLMNGSKQVSTFTGTIYKLGNIDSLKSNELEHEFCIKNSQSVPMTLETITLSCSCIKIEVNGSLKEFTPIELKPNEILRIKMSLKREQLSPGVVNANLWLFAKGVVEPATTLTMSGVLSK